MLSYNKFLKESKNIEDVIQILKDVTAASEWETKLYMAGGYVRDKLLKKDPKDIDFVVEGPPTAGIDAATFIAKKLNVFKQDSNPVTYPTYGTAKLNIPVNGEIVEVEFVAPRVEKYEVGSRKPLVFAGTLEDDAKRRDFTVNSLFQNLTTNEIKDLTGRGISDLNNKILKTTGDADWIFSEDPLRILRAVRFALKYNFTLPISVIKAIKNASKDLNNISKERIKDELNKILVLSTPSKAIRLFKITGIMDIVLPELSKLVDLKQNSYHKDDAFYHTLDVLDKTPPELIRRLSALFHDIGKAATRTEKNGKVQFIGHANVGSLISKTIMRRLKYSNEDIDKVSKIVDAHMDLKSGGKEAEILSDGTLRKLIFKIADNLEPLLDVVHADNISHSEAASMPEQINKVREKIAGMDINSILNTKSILDGNDIIQLGAKGKLVGEIKDRLLTMALKNPEFTKEQAINLAKNLIRDSQKQ